jgi:hypothetical protein
MVRDSYGERQVQRDGQNLAGSRRAADLGRERIEDRLRDMAFHRLPEL